MIDRSICLSVHVSQWLKVVQKYFNESAKYHNYFLLLGYSCWQCRRWGSRLSPCYSHRLSFLLDQCDRQHSRITQKSMIRPITRSKSIQECDICRDRSTSSADSCFSSGEGWAINWTYCFMTKLFHGKNAICKVRLTGNVVCSLTLSRSRQLMHQLDPSATF